MPEIIMYTKTTCGYCKMAIALLNKKNLPFTEIIIDNNEILRQEMIAKSGRTTVPQIFINGNSIGGCDDLHALDESGQLDKDTKND